MSPITKIQTIGVLILAMLTIQGCGSSTPNSEAVFKSTSKAHVADWLPAGHMTAARADEASCAECHGSDYSGGVAGVSCSQCHLGGSSSVHPVSWGQQTDTVHASYVTANGNSACANANCHGSDLAGVAGSGPSCAVTCHLGSAASVHPADWGALTYYKHSVYSQASGTASCANVNCHGAGLTGVAGSGPSCTKCHLGGVSSVHPADWSSDLQLHKQYVQSNGSSACSNVNCHGANLQGVTASGPSCYTCH